MRLRSFVIFWLLIWYAAGAVTHTGGLLAGVVGTIALTMIAADLRAGLDDIGEVI